MSHADTLMLQLSDRHRTDAVRLLATDALLFFEEAVAKSLKLTQGQLRDREATLRKRHRGVSAPITRLVLMAARELVVPVEFGDIASLGAVREVFPEPSPLTPRCLRAAEGADQLESAYVRWRLRSCPVLSSLVAAGEVLLLCVLRGGILDDDSLDALAHQPLAEWQLASIKGNEPLKTPWHAIPAEALLAVRAFAQHHSDLKTLLPAATRAAAAIEALLQRCQCETVPSLHSLWRSAAARLRRDAPDWLARIIAGAEMDVPAQPATRWRLMTDFPLLKNIPILPDAATPDAGNIALIESDSTLPAWREGSAFLNRLCAGLKKSPRALDALSMLEELAEDVPDPLCGLIVMLADSWMRRAKPQLPQSVARYVSALRGLPQSAGTQSPFYKIQDIWHADGEVWTHILTTAARPGFRRDEMTLRELSRLHRFACKVFPDLNDCDLDEIEGMDVDIRTRAVLITDTEMRRSVEHLRATSPQHVGGCLCAEVAYASAARIRELSHARLSDLRIDTTRLILKIRAHRDRRLKTPSARRDLPLHHLLSNEQQQRLRDYAQALAQSGHAPGDIYLFAPLARPDRPPSDDQLHALIQSLREITGDRDITFHSLRHSAATWLVLQILSYEVPSIAALPLIGSDASRFARTTVTSLVGALCPDLARAPLGRLPAGWTQALARLLGHADFATTLRHYIHLRPLYQPHVLVREWGELPASLLAKLANIPERTARDQAARWRHLAPARRQYATRAQALIYAKHEADVAEQVDSLIRESTPPPPLEVVQLARATVHVGSVAVACRLLSGGRTIDNVAKLLGYPIGAISRTQTALNEKIVADRYAPAFLPPRKLDRARDNRDFDFMAKALDRTKVSKEAFSAWRHVVDAGNRWVVTRDDDVEQLIDFLLSLLPTHTCVYVELQSIAGEKERLTAEQREHRFWSRITVSRSERLRIKAYDYGDGPNWRYRPAGEKADDCREWMHLRLCKLPWPGEESRLERCPGYTRALQCWRVSHDLREPKWARYRR